MQLLRIGAVHVAISKKDVGSQIMNPLNVVSDRLVLEKAVSNLIKLRLQPRAITPRDPAGAGARDVTTDRVLPPLV
jgi:hypothetical protein